jgi:hypothetical protein
VLSHPGSHAVAITSDPDWLPEEPPLLELPVIETCDLEGVSPQVGTAKTPEEKIKERTVEIKSTSRIIFA